METFSILGTGPPTLEVSQGLIFVAKCDESASSPLSPFASITIIEPVSIRMLNSVVKENYTGLAKVFVDIVKRCNENLENEVAEFCAETLPDGSQLTTEVVQAVAVEIKPAMKLSRIGLGAKVSFSLILTYADLATDCLVLKEYWDGGESKRKYFFVSFGILALSTLINMIVAWIANRKKSKSAKTTAVVVASLQLNPLVHGINHWRGVPIGEDDLLSPFVVFLVVRLGELLCEVVPETVLQLYVIYHTKDVSLTIMSSILSSLASAAFIMTDNSMMQERGRMVSERGEGDSKVSSWFHQLVPFFSPYRAHSHNCYTYYTHIERAEARTLLAPLSWVHPNRFS